MTASKLVSKISNLLIVEACLTLVKAEKVLKTKKKRLYWIIKKPNLMLQETHKIIREL